MVRDDARARALKFRAQLQPRDDRPRPYISRAGGNFVQTQIIHCHCKREASLGRNSKLHVKSGRSILADNMQMRVASLPLLPLPPHQYAEDLLPTDFIGARRTCVAIDSAVAFLYN